uniref:McrB family protein n=1 Tax=uncultured Polaribacter sp. TaxID=174711 RepID=UPI002625822F|nr:AAA family ATPase [uncultured Polaribacter sp.]
MNKYITLENKIYEAKPVLILQKVNDEILPTNRKNGSGADKNQFFIQSEFYYNLNTFFPEVIKDREEKKTGRNKPVVKNYFDISSIANDISIINKEIERHYPDEDKLNLNELVEKMKDLSKSQNLNSTFYIESEIANAQNGIAFKNWKTEFKQIIKQLLLPTTQIKVYLFNQGEEVCAFWQFNQDYIIQPENLMVKTQPKLIIEQKKLRNIIFQSFKYLMKKYGEEICLSGYELKQSRIENRNYQGLTINKYFGFEVLIGIFDAKQNNEELKSSGTLRFINEEINILNNENCYFTTQWNESNGRGLSLTNFNSFIADISDNQLEIIKEEDKFKLIQKNDFLFKPQNKIFFGAPGTGKSHKVNELIKAKKSEDRTERITFHPEYDYSSFVGGYKPTMDGDKIKYEFVPQAFTNIYVNAWNDLDNDYYLVIEEINRGNCAEIFGDIFQLLDRSNDYKITPSKELKEYLETKFSGNENIDESKLLLPPNLNILATMNTSDQSLFPMDSAFKRRWDWEYIPINYSENIEENTSAKFVVELMEGASFNWLDFIKNVNKLIKSNDNLGMDKCLGNYFIKPDINENTISLKSFINKAIFYLWNDVFKDEIEDESIFKNKTSYEDFFPIDDKGVEKVKDILKILKPDNESSVE